MAAELFDLTGRLQVVDANDPVVAAGQRQAAVRRNRDPARRPARLPAAELSFELAGLKIEELHPARPIARQDRSTVGCQHRCVGMGAIVAGQKPSAVELPAVKLGTPGAESEPSIGSELDPP